MNKPSIESGEVEQLRQALAERTAQLETMTRELDEFSYSVSHDLRAPLRAIEGFSKILQEDHSGKLDEEAQRFLKIIDASSRRMTGFLDDLLKLSRLSRQEVRPSRLKMELAVNSVWEQLHPESASRNVELKVSSLPDGWGDPSLIQHVWRQLLDNALKFTAPKGNAIIEISGTHEPGRVVYRIKDNGVGFDMKCASRLFGVFQRLHAPEEFHGNGIGLAIVRRSVRRNSGEAWAEAEPGGGATFYFSLPPAETESEVNR